MDITLTQLDCFEYCTGCKGNAVGMCSGDGESRALCASCFASVEPKIEPVDKESLMEWGLTTEDRRELFLHWAGYNDVSTGGRAWYDPVNNDLSSYKRAKAKQKARGTFSDWMKAQGYYG